MKSYSSKNIEPANITSIKFYYSIRIVNFFMPSLEADGFFAIANKLTIFFIFYDGIFYRSTFKLTKTLFFEILFLTKSTLKILNRSPIPIPNS